jgi:hypothetical protein
VGAHVWRNNQPSELESALPAPATPRSKPNSASQQAKPDDRIAELEEALAPHEEQANKMLTEIGWINDGDTTGQTFRDMNNQRAKEVLARPADFLAKALAT